MGAFAVFPNENFMDIRLFQYGWEQCEPLHSFGPYIRNHYLFHYIIQGQGTLDSDDENGVTRRYSLHAGQGFLICPGQVNTYSADRVSPWKYVWLEFDGLRAQEYLEDAGLNINRPVYVPADAQRGGRVQEAMLGIADHSGASPIALIGRTYLFLDELIQGSTGRKEIRQPRIRDYYIQEAVTFIEHNYQRELTVEKIADVCGLNRCYFSKLFKAHLGCPPQEFILRLRMSKALELLKNEQLPIAEVARQCGFPNPLHFSRTFRKRYGVSPRDWRRENRE